MNKEYHFYDTSSLLERANKLFQQKENIIISTTVLEELEHIKVSRKDENVKCAARKVLKLLQEHIGEYETVIFKPKMLKPIVKNGFQEDTNDLRILAAAILADSLYPDNVIFYTNDLSLYNIANLFFGEDSIRSVEEVEEEDDYAGYLTIQMTDEEMADFYAGNKTIQILPNEYLFIQNEQGEIVDTLCSCDSTFRSLNYGIFQSTLFGKVKPKPNDLYQACAFDSLLNNQITLLKGPAGSGKSVIALSYLFSQLEKGKIDRIIIFCNTVAVKNSAKLGYYPGDKNVKLLDSQIGNFLASKLGDKMLVEQMIDEGTLILLPMSDIRGYDTSGLRAGVYITEAQNMDVSLMKLALQRIGEDSHVIIDGDCDTQVDDDAFSGKNNGMRRLSQVFRGTELYGEITLKNIHRSKIATIAGNM